MSKRKIIFVDASCQKDNLFISLFEQSTHTGLTTQINYKDFAIDNINQCEGLAIFNAILYAKKKNYKQAMILCDNETAVNKYKSFDKNIRVVWVPREINIVADKLSRLPNNTKKEDVNLLKYFFSSMRLL